MVGKEIPATTEIASTGSAAPRAVPTATLKRWVTAVAAVMAARTVRVR
jgi:hypothetical protein